jgi:spore maturation protein CgeB
MKRSLDIVIFGLTLSSSWGNGHATTFRSLIEGLSRLGHRVLFLERDQPWYAENRDLVSPAYCELDLYDDPNEALLRHDARLRHADAVLVCSYVPEATWLIDRLIEIAAGRLHFYDIDTPVTLDHLARGDASYLARRQIPMFETIFSFAGSRALRLLEETYGARRALPLYCSVDPDRYRPLDLPRRWDLGYLGTHSDDRLPGLESLLLAPARARPDLRFVVAGSQYPTSIKWPANVERIEHLPPQHHARFYCSQRFTLNLTRASMRRLGHAPSVRIFEAAACGIPVISDHSDGLTDLLPDREAVRLAFGTGDVLAALGLDDAEARCIGRAARERVLAGHTGAIRGAQLTEALGQSAGLFAVS